MRPLPHRSTAIRGLRLAASLLTASCLAACATPGVRNPADPLESVNRVVYKFNDVGDRLVLKPVATVYAGVLPQVFRTGVHNFFSNLNDVVVVVNDLLQGKGTNASRDGVRLMANTVFGGLGLFDVASRRGIPKRSEDFGQTLAVWGVPSGPYLVLPFLGPSTVRDGVGRFADSYIDPVWQFAHVPARNGAAGIRLVDARASILPAEKLFEQAAVDRYSFLRDAYLQRRRSLIYDGNPPQDPEDDYDDGFDQPGDKAVPDKQSMVVEPDRVVPARPREPALIPSAHVIRVF